MTQSPRGRVNAGSAPDRRCGADVIRRVGTHSGLGWLGAAGNVAERAKTFGDFRRIGAICLAARRRPQRLEPAAHRANERLAIGGDIHRL